VYNNRVFIARMTVEEDLGDREDMMEDETPSVKAATCKLITVMCLALLLTAVGLVGCSLLTKSPLPSQEEKPTATTVPLKAMPSVSPAPSRPPTVSSVITITLWTTEDFFPTEDSDSGQILAQQWQAFQAAHPSVIIEYVLKKPYGKGGILDFLSTAHAAAPTVLPDLVILDTFELDEAAEAGLVQSLDKLVSSELQQDLFAFARRSFNGQLMGIQFEADVEHLDGTFYVLTNDDALDFRVVAAPADGSAPDPASWPDVVPHRPGVRIEALDVLREPVGMCRDYAVLYAALARAAGLPTRVCAGIVYFRDRFYYHAWAESYAAGRWVPVDGTVAPGFADASHIKFAQGDGATMYGATKIIGRLRAEVLEQR